LAELKTGLVEQWQSNMVIIGTEFGRTAKKMALEEPITAQQVHYLLQVARVMVLKCKANGQG